MGGYGSGRPKMSHLTTELLAIDTMQFKKYLRTPGIAKGHLIITSGTMKDDCPDGEIPGLAYTIECVSQSGTLTLEYIARSGEREQEQSACIPLVTTPCNYGGHRWWMQCPCCDTRARVVYIGSSMYPMCRMCQDLHYQSQRSSYIERHITYEKYLLSNYGYYWAYDRYHSLKEHYFKITPEYAYKMRKSQLEQDLHLIRLYIKFEIKMLKIYLRDIASLQSDEDKHVYLEHIAKEHGQDYALDTVHLLGLSIQFERAVRTVADTSVLNQFFSDEDAPEPECVSTGDEPESRKLKLLRSKEQAIKQEMQALEKEAA